MHKAWHRIEKVPYCFARSSIKFEAYTHRKIDDLNPIWVRLLGRSQLSNPSELPCFTLRLLPTCVTLLMSSGIFNNGSGSDLTPVRHQTITWPNVNWTSYSKGILRIWKFPLSFIISPVSEGSGDVMVLRRSRPPPAVRRPPPAARHPPPAARRPQWC